MSRILAVVVVFFLLTPMVSAESNPSNPQMWFGGAAAVMPAPTDYVLEFPNGATLRRVSNTMCRVSRPDLDEIIDVEISANDQIIVHAHQADPSQRGAAELRGMIRYSQEAKTSNKELRDEPFAIPNTAIRFIAPPMVTWRAQNVRVAFVVRRSVNEQGKFLVQMDWVKPNGEIVKFGHPIMDAQRSLVRGEDPSVVEEVWEFEFPITAFGIGRHTFGVTRAMGLIGRPWPPSAQDKTIAITTIDVVEVTKMIEEVISR